MHLEEPRGTTALHVNYDTRQKAQLEQFTLYLRNCNFEDSTTTTRTTSPTWQQLCNLQDSTIASDMMPSVLI
jgi:hypothetical protein